MNNTIGYIQWGEDQLGNAICFYNEYGKSGATFNQSMYRGKKHRYFKALIYAKMKRVYIIQTENDGLMTTGLSNTTALFDYLSQKFNIKELHPYNEYKPKPFNKSVLCAEIKENKKGNKFYVACLTDADGEEINIMELTVFSSY
jgi:hypothetical protein